MARRRVPRGAIVSGTWWALVRTPKALPVLFSTKAGAEESADHDEQLVRVIVVGATARDREARNGK